MAKNNLFPTLPLLGGSKIADKIDIEVIKQNLLRFNQPDKRGCLCCEEKFDSEGVHNRYCKKCKIKYGEELYTVRKYPDRRGAERKDCDRRKNYE